MNQELRENIVIPAPTASLRHFQRLVLISGLIFVAYLTGSLIQNIGSNWNSSDNGYSKPEYYWTYIEIGIAFLFTLSLIGFSIIYRKSQTDATGQSIVAQRARDFAEASSDWFWEMDEQLRFTYISPNFERLMGVPINWHIGKSAEEVYGASGLEEEAKLHLKQLKAHKPYRDFIFLRVAEDGARIWTASNAIPFYKEDGSFGGYRGTGRNITRQKELELNLQDAESQFGAIFEHSQVGITITDGDGNRLATNNAFNRMIGYPNGLPENTTVASDSHPDEIDESLKILREWSSGIIDNVQWKKRFVRPDGSVVWTNANLSVLPNKVNGKRIAVSQYLDITDQVETENLLRDSEERFKSFAAAGSDWFWEMDADLRFSYISENDEKHLGVPCQSIIGMTRDQLIEPEAQDELWDQHKALLKGRQPFRDYTYRRVKGRGTAQWVSISGRPKFGPNGKFLGYRGIGRDITHDRQIEFALRNSETRFREMFEHSHVGLCILDETGRRIRVNKAFCDMLGCTVEEATEMDVASWVHPDEQEASYKLLDDWRNGRTEHITYKKRFIRKNGTTIWTSANLSVLREEVDGKKVALAQFMDITEQETAAATIRKSEEQFRTIFEESQVGMVLMSDSGIRVDCNDALCRLLGYSKSEIIGTNSGDFAHPDDWELSEKVRDDWVSGRRNYLRFEKRYIRKDGSVVWTNVTVSKLPNRIASNIGAITQIQDITQQKSYEDALLQANDNLELLIEERTKSLTQEIFERKQAERSLKESERQLRDFGAAASDWYWETDSDSNVTYVSQGFEAITGVPINSVTGKPLGNLYKNHMDPDAWNERLQYHIEKKAYRNFIRPHTKADGSTVWISLNGKPIFSGEGEFLGYRGTGTDVTEIQNSQQQLLDLSAAIDSLDQPVAIFDEDDRFVFYNREFEQYNDVPPECLGIGIPFADYVRGVAEIGVTADIDVDIETWISQRLDRHRQAES